MTTTVARGGDRPTFVWIEGERPSSANVEPNTSGWGNQQYLSEENWLSVTIDAAKVEAEAPDEGVLLAYDFTIDTAGRYEAWNRIGFEFVRSPFDWRIDDGPWTTVQPEELTTDLMEIAYWCEVAWFHLGDAQLTAGPHQLQIRLSKRKNDQGEFQTIRYASDALCFSLGPFYPNSKYKPGDEGRDARDEEATKHVFQLPEPDSAAPGSRQSVLLAGLWEVCRFDEQLPGETARPIEGFPAQPHWKAIDVPGDKNTQRHDLLFAHRLWYRTRVEVSEADAGRSFHIVFPQNNLNTTVYVNGEYCGFNKNPYARFAIDVTAGMRPGLNEIWVGIRDAWYGYSTNPDDPMKLRRKFNLPIKYLGEGFQDLAYPIWRHPQSGILVAPELIVGGEAYANYVSCSPSVELGGLALRVEIHNTSSQAISGELICEVVNDETNEVEKTFPPHTFSSFAGGQGYMDFGENWEDPKLWWPDDPNLYRLRTTLRTKDRVIDVSEVTFGFREWTLDGTDFRLNGVVWHGWADCFRAKNPREWIEFYRKTDQRMMRFWGTRWQGLPPEEALDFMDRQGVPVRRSGILDGEAIGYNAVEHDPDLKELFGSEIKMDLMQNWRDQMVAQVRGERNHPSVMIWSIENEWLYINCINLHGRLMDEFEAEVVKVSDAVRAEDPTRPTMVDGGGACKSNGMPVAGDHYVFKEYSKYPDQAYDANPTGGGRGRWEWDQQRPRFLGEDYFANGINPFDYSYFGGEETFQGKAQSRRAAGIIYRMLTEGYRWAEYGAWHFWAGQNEAIDQYGSNAPLAVFCRQWDWTFASAQRVKRTMRIFNDTRFDQSVNFAWSLEVDGAETVQGSDIYQVTAGSSHQFELILPAPTVGDRSEGRFLVALSTDGEEVFRDVKDVSVLNTDPRGSEVAGLADLRAEDLLVHDPLGEVVEFLRRGAIPFTQLDDIETLPDSGKVLLIGPDAVRRTESDSSKFQAYAAGGRSVIVLEQTHPLRYQAIAADVAAVENQGRTAFIEDLSHPVFAGLRQKDFFTWAGDHVVYRNAYLKPTRGGKSLVQCHNRLQNTALVESPAGEGLLLVCQLVVGEKLPASPVARRLLTNLIGYAASYKLEFRPVVVCGDGVNPHLINAFDGIRLQYSTVDDPLAALTSAGVGTAVVPATPGNLKRLADNMDQVDRFTAAGGQLVLHGLEPDGLADYNRLVGFDHMIRPFAMERVTFPSTKNPLTAGLTAGDVVMRSGERIFGWTSDEYLADDVFTYVVDYDDVAPFAEFPDEFSRNLVNGMTSADAWKYIVNLPAPDNPPLDWVLRFPKEQELVEMTWTGNTFYYPVTKAQLFFDGDASHAASFATEPINEPQTFAIDPPIRGRDMTVRLADWDRLPDKKQVTGLDNIALRAARSAEFYRTVRPLVNVGGMMQYLRGSGGIVLCNLRFQEHEAVPENGLKKRAILAAVLRNLKAPFAEGKTIIAGARLAYEPLDISGKCNQFRDQRGWFGDRAFTFSGMPPGRQTFAGVPFEIYDFPTSPVPTVVMLGGRGVPGELPDAVGDIPVGRKLDALFFLHTARLDARRHEREIREDKRYEMLRYVITYADGRTEDVPIHAEIDIEDFRQEDPRAIPGAQLAWIRPWEGTGLSAVAYVKQWNNPRPEVEVKSVDMLYGESRRGVPVLIAVTAASAD